MQRVDAIGLVFARDAIPVVTHKYGTLLRNEEIDRADETVQAAGQ
jgi:hypothetical protein